MTLVWTIALLTYITRGSLIYQDAALSLLCPEPSESDTFVFIFTAQTGLFEAADFAVENPSLRIKQ